MAFKVHTREAFDLIETAHGSVDALVVAWEAEAERGRPGFGKPRSRAAIYKWLKSGFPLQPDAVLAFCALLNVDPLTIMDLEASDVFRTFSRLRLSFQLGGGIRAPFKAISRLFYPGPNWPDEQLARVYYGRSWYTAEFKHDALAITMEYALVDILPVGSAPMTVYVAYRRTGAADKMWRPYGAVIRRGGTISLISESGHFAQKPGQTFSFDTYFGPGPAQFKLASLHDFSFRIDVPTRTMNPLRFVG
jgi:hypothetical protein